VTVLGFEMRLWHECVLSSMANGVTFVAESM
jgi:hypothetical protein